jgi:uncharacterized protein
MGMFEWFDLRTTDSGAAREFYATLLDWEVQESGMVVADGRPWAAVTGDDDEPAPHWLPFVRVADADWATMRAKELGAEVVAGVVQGPAGRFSRIKDPSGAPVALWEPAA